jgi:hypothetical protein
MVEGQQGAIAFPALVCGDRAIASLPDKQGFGLAFSIGE